MSAIGIVNIRRIIIIIFVLLICPRDMSRSNSRIHCTVDVICIVSHRRWRLIRSHSSNIYFAHVCVNGIHSIRLCAFAIPSHEVINHFCTSLTLFHAAQHQFVVHTMVELDYFYCFEKQTYFTFQISIHHQRALSHTRSINHFHKLKFRKRWSIPVAVLTSIEQ